MTRDYKNVTEARAGHKKTQSKNKSPSGSTKSLPGWLLLVSGVIIGGFVSFIVYLKLSVPIDVIENKPKPEKVEKKSSSTNQQIKTERKNPEPEKQEKEQFEFYKILPNREVVLPENAGSPEIDKNSQEDKKNKSRTESSAESGKGNVDSVKSESVSKPVSYIYILQVGSFLEFKDADKRKANLALLGIGSRIHSIKTNGRTHYRIIVGPYEDIKRINEIDAIMKANNINTLLLKEKG